MLNRSHPYHYQVQTQIFLSKSQYCDFVVFTLKDLFVERIELDSKFCKAMVENAADVYRQIILPELLGQVFTRSTNAED